MSTSKPALDNPRAAEAVRRSMGYHDGTKTCDRCKHFLAPGAAARRARPTCTANTFEIEVSEKGGCRVWGSTDDAA